MTPDIREKAERLASDIGNFVLKNGVPPLSLERLLSQALLEAHNAGRAEERERCLSLANGWLIQFSETGEQLKFITPQDYANGAVEDIAELIASGVDPFPATAIRSIT